MFCGDTLFYKVPVMIKILYRQISSEKQKTAYQSKNNFNCDDTTDLKSLLYRRKLSSQCADDVSETSSSLTSPRANSPSSMQSSRYSTTGRSPRMIRFQTEESSSVNSQGPFPDRPSAGRRIDSRKRQRAYATHRRRTWSHLLDKKP